MRYVFSLNSDQNRKSVYQNVMRFFASDMGDVETSNLYLQKCAERSYVA